MESCLEKEIEISRDDGDEKYKCGEVFMYICQKSLTFVCSLCDETFKELDTFTAHLYEEFDKIKQDDCNEEEFRSFDPNEDCNQDEHTNNENAGLEPMHSMFLYEEPGEDKQKTLDTDDVEDERLWPMHTFAKSRMKQHGKRPTAPVCQAHEEEEPKKERKNAKQSSYKCSECDKVFLCRLYLQNHSYTHFKVKPFPCDFCGARFANKTNLLVHTRRHTGEKPYVCDFCPRSFKSSTERKSHMRIHTGDRPYVCEECGRGHSSSGQLLQHRRRTHLNQRDYKCEECGRAFISNTKLREHIYVVHGDAPRDKKCDVCNATFKTVKSLSAHKFIHKEKSFLCVICGKAFAQKPGLYSHMKTHNLVKKSSE